MYKCLECGHIFDEGEEKNWMEAYGEYMTGCPMCMCAYDDAYMCIQCGSYHLSDELYSGLCLDCITEQATPHNLADWAETDPMLNDEFYSYYYDSLIIDPGQQLRQLLRGGLLQRASIEKLSGLTETHDKCKGFVLNSEENTTDFAKWLTAKKGKKI